MICQGVGHTTKCTNVVVSDIVEEVRRHFITNCWFKNFLLMVYRKPLMSFEAS